MKLRDVSLKTWIKYYTLAVLYSCTGIIFVQIILAALGNGNVLVHYNEYNELYFELVMVLSAIILGAKYIYDEVQK